MYILYKVILYIHILSVISSIGPFVILFPIAKKLRVREDSGNEGYLNVFQSVVRLAKHAGHVLVGSGVLLVIIGPWTWKTAWIDMTLIILAASLYFLARAFSPKLRKYRQQKEGFSETADSLRNAVYIYMALLLIMLWFMVAKPVLW